MDVTEFNLAAVVTDLDTVERAEVADVLEFRMDHAEDPLQQLASYDGNLPIIATNRSKAEGGTGGPNRLKHLAEAATDPSVAAIDVELASIEDGEASDVLRTSRKTDTAVVVSWHDFDGTPSPTILERRLRSACAQGTVGKVAVTAHDSGDVLDLLTVTHRLANEGHLVATMSMGEAGRHSRIVAPLYGSRIGYAPLDVANATAPGQFTLRTMAELLETIS